MLQCRFRAAVLSPVPGPLRVANRLHEALPSRPPASPVGAAMLGQHRHLVRAVSFVGAGATVAPGQRKRSLRAPPAARLALQSRSAPPPRPSCVVRWGWTDVRAGSTAPLPSRPTRRATGASVSVSTAASSQLCRPLGLGRRSRRVSASAPFASLPPRDWRFNLCQHRRLVPAVSCVGAGAASAPGPRLRFLRAPPAARWALPSRSAPPPRPRCVVRWGWSGGHAGSVQALSLLPARRAKLVLQSRSAPPACPNCGVFGR